LLFDLPFLIVPTFAWQRVREIFYTAIGTGANVQIAPTGAASLWGEAPPRLEAGIWASIPSVRPPNPHRPASMPLHDPLAGLIVEADFRAGATFR